VGALEESITVTGEAPVVDIQNIREQTTIRRDMLDALPTTRRLAQLATLIPAATTGGTTFHDVGGVGSDRGQIATHGQRPDDMSWNVGGIDSRVFTGGNFMFNVHTFQELVVETLAGSAETSTGGVQLNVVPKDGGNRFSGTFSTEYTGPSLQTDNVNEELRARGLTAGPASSSVRKYYDTGGGIGGPIKQNKL